MNTTDFFYILRWFFAFFIVGSAFLPFTFSIFSQFKDKGYIFSKVIGSIVISYLIFVFGLLHLIRFSAFFIYLLLFFLFIVNYSFAFYKKINIFKLIKKYISLFLIEEVIFLSLLTFWSFVRSNFPDINGLEKFMDFGFLNSILRSDYFPPKDMWYTPYSINYYYFGHLITAVYTKISFFPSYISYNLMISTLFALTFSTAFSIGLNLYDFGKNFIKPFIAALLSAFLVTFSGNLTTIYSFFKAYVPADKPVPFWKLSFLPFNFPNDYWYPNATRFIPFTIHEFPIYSFVVSDLHGHVLDIPIVLLFIAYCLSIIKNGVVNVFNLLFVSFLIAVMYMTNAWDGLIYLLLFFFLMIFIYLFLKKGKWKFSLANIYNVLKKILVVFVGFIIFSLPFSINFKPFVSAIGIICAPKFLTTIGKLGPFIFEANHCQRSPIWQLIILYGFFYFFAISLLLFIKFKKKYKPSANDYFVLILIFLSTILIVVPEFVYVKDIYPLHYRANTMFKLVYESFIMLSIVSSFTVVKLLSEIKYKITLFIFFFISIFLISLVSLYPFFAINSYYRNLKSYTGLDGLKYFKNIYSGDYALINWLNKNIKGQPIILEANGDSYTNYSRISANTGLPTVLGWTVHEWLWRGSYNIVSPRIADVETLYSSEDLKQVSSLVRRYNISYIVVSDLERDKYPNLTEGVFKKIGKIVFASEQTKLYKINSVASEK